MGSTQIIIYFNTIFCSKCRWVNLTISNRFIMFFDVLLYYYISLKLSIIFFLFCGDMYLSFGISMKCYIFYCSEAIKAFVILSVIKITSCFCCFLNCFFEAVLKASVVDCLAWSRSFRLYLLLKCLLMFLPIFLRIF